MHTHQCMHAHTHTRTRTHTHTHTVQSCRDRLPDPMRVVIDEILPSLTGGMDLGELNRQFIERHQDSLQHLIHG